jgi:hypothetical protein
MGNLIIDASNYSSLLNGKTYIWDEYACNYPVSATIFTGTVSVTNGNKLISTTGDFYSLLGADISNTNVPLHKFIAGFDSTPSGCIFEIDHLLSSTEAVLKQTCSYATGDYECIGVDFFGQPRVEQTYGIDSSSGFGGTCPYYDKYGVHSVFVGTQTVAMGNEPLLVNLATAWNGYAINIQYSS